jgi:hypothetical protein
METRKMAARGRVTPSELEARVGRRTRRLRRRAQAQRA